MTPEARYRRAILRWFRDHPRTFPWRTRRDLYGLLVGEVLLQRTRGENVVDVYVEFLQRWPNPQQLAGARTTSVASVIRPLGLTKRAPILKQLGIALVGRGHVRPEPDELLSLPGIGPYAAHAVPVFGFGRNLPVVDWVIARVLRRYFGLAAAGRPNTDRDLWALAERLVRPGRAHELWLGTLDFAAAVCRPRPLCGECPLNKTCAYFSRSSRTGLVTPTP